MPGSLQSSPADERGGEFGKAPMHQQMAVPGDGQVFELMEVGNGLLHDPADAPEADDLLAPPLGMIGSIRLE
jgi:hypothetical protein